MGFLSVLIIIISLLLIIVVLIQNSKGGGIASNFASSTQVVGVKRQAEIIEKITWGLATALIVLSLGAAALTGGTEGTTTQDNTDAVIKNSTLPPTTTIAPTGGTGAPTMTPNGTTTVTPTPTPTTGTQNP